jgi:hypothetical protein
VDGAYKLAKHLKIAMLYLEDDDAVNAEMYIKKAAQLITSSEDAEMQLQYKVGCPSWGGAGRLHLAHPAGCGCDAPRGSSWAGALQAQREAWLPSPASAAARCQLSTRYPALGCALSLA